MSARDSDPIIAINDTDDLSTITTDIALSVNWKFFIMLFITFMFLMSDIFINRVLDRLDGAVYNKNPTTYGVVIQGLIMVIIMMIFNALIQYGVI
jgi:hypothetical protein